MEWNGMEGAKTEKKQKEVVAVLAILVAAALRSLARSAQRLLIRLVELSIPER